ncbi:MAG: ATP-binding cassette domain-containing protein [Methanobacteriaceae archaeon]|nr:ATP-binding cassette domain-containing protein [Methanobacteriaceae archaeon]
MVLKRCSTLSKKILQLKAVNKIYPTPGEGETLALNNVSMKLNSKKFTMVVGPMGSGKSTLFRIAGLLESPSSGSVIFDQADLTNPTPHERLNIIRNEMGFVPPYPSLLPYLTLLENVMLPMRNNDKSLAQDMLKNFGLEGISYPNEISVEEQQKTSILRAIINQPQILLVDDPTSSLSATETTDLIKLLVNLKKDYAVLVFSDDMKLVKYSDMVFKLNKGVLCEDKCK